MPDVTQRTLSLLAALQTGRSFPGEELAARLGVSPRTLRRDIDRIRGYGYPVETRPGPGGHYRLTAGTALPPLMLGDDEAIATLLGLAVLAAPGGALEGSVEEAATRAYGKIEQYLPKRLRPRAAGLRASLETGAAAVPGARAADLGTMADAVRNRRVVAFEYERRDGAAALRRVEPYRQVHRHLRWYLLGWDLDKDDWRVFRIDRVAALRVTTASFTPRALPAGTAIDYLDQGLQRHRERVVLVVDAPSAAVLDAFRYEDVDLAPLDERRTEVVLWLDTWEWLPASLAFLGADFTVEEPRAFREALRRFGGRLVSGAGGAASASGADSPERSLLSGAARRQGRSGASGPAPLLVLDAGAGPDLNLRAVGGVPSRHFPALVRLRVHRVVRFGADPSPRSGSVACPQLRLRSVGGRAGVEVESAPVRRVRCEIRRESTLC